MILVTSLTVLSVALCWVRDTEKENSVLLLKKSNFDRALTETKYLLVEFYAPWSYDCRKLLPIWDELGEKYQNHEDVIIAKIDVTANDVLSVVMDRYPFFRLFPAGPDIQVRNSRGWHSCLLMGGCACTCRIEAHPLSKALLFIYSTLKQKSMKFS
uniref:Protein disulfide isomerase like, testis expressed n=1 Tax=Phasianus colchicus TaxID=9054 RepID=A0A669PJJ3_PHACC